MPELNIIFVLSCFPKKRKTTSCIYVQ